MTTATSHRIVSLRTLTQADATRAGGKAAHCARLLQAGFPVPDGFVVLPGDGSPITAADLEPYLLAFEPGVRFAVRSSGADEDSAESSFAGIHLTELNVVRAEVPSAIAACMASESAQAAQAYRSARGVAEASAHMAVLVQQMVQAEVAGVAFTVDPLGQYPNCMVINAAWGLGEAVVSGRVDPDEFQVDRTSGRLVRAQLGMKAELLVQDAGVARWMSTTPDQRERACLTPEQLAGLTRLLVRIEGCFGTPQDVEWCLRDGAFYVVQSRPITTGEGSLPADREWSRANALEGLPDLPSPQVSNAITSMVDRAMRQLFPEFWAPEAALGPLATTICGRPYYNLSQFRHMSRVTGTAAEKMITQFGGVAHPDDYVRPHLGLRAVVRLLPAALRLVRLRLTAGRSLESSLAVVRERLAALAAVDPASLSDQEVWERVRIPDDIGALMGGAPASAGFTWALLKAPCRRAAHTMDRLLHAHLAAAPKTSNALQGMALIELAAEARRDSVVVAYFEGAGQTYGEFRTALAGSAFLRAFDAFLERYGHCGNYEKDWSLPRYAEDPEALLHAIGLHVTSGEVTDTRALDVRQQQELADAWADFERNLGPRRSRVLRPLVRSALSGVAWNRYLRESGRFENAKLVAEGRRWHLALAQRFVDRGWLDAAEDYFFLHLDEVKAALGSEKVVESCRSVVARRKREREQWLDLELPMILRDSAIPHVGHGVGVAAHSTGAETFTGTSVSRGSVTGEVVVIRSVSEFPKMKHAAVIVAPATDPSWTPLFTLAAGVVTEIGGTLSHSATLARELGIPAISNVINATRLLRDGDRVTIDAVKGVVHRLP